MTIRELALAFLKAESYVISDTSGQYERDYNELWQQTEHEINPLLVSHGEQPLTREDAQI